MKRSKSTLGIYIDDDSLSMVLLGETKEGVQVRKWATEPLEEGLVENGSIINGGAISHKIRHFTKAHRIKAHKVVISPSLASVRLKASKITTQTDEQLHKEIEEQVAKYALFGSEQIVFDYCTIDGPVDTPNGNVVLQAVTTRRISDACLTVAHKARLKLVEVQPVILPIIRVACDKVPADSGSVSLLLALDSVSSNMIVFKAGQLRFCQNLSIGNKGISQEENGITSLTDQMKAVLEFARSLAGSQKLVLRVAANGSSKQLGAVVGQIKQSLTDVKVEQINPAQVAKQFDVEGADSGDLPIFAFACALTGLDVFEFAEQLDLVSKESRAMHKTQDELSLMAKAVAVIVILSVAAIFPLKKKIGSVEASSAEIEAQIAQTVPMEQKIAGLMKQIKQLKKQQSAYTAAGQELICNPWPEVLQAIGDSVPDEVRIVDIATSDSDFTLVGESLAENDVHRFAGTLQNSKVVDSANVEDIEYFNSGAKTMVDYTIVCTIQPPEDDS